MNDKVGKQAANLLGLGGDRMAHVEYGFLCPDGPKAEWRVRRMVFVESLSEPYQLVLDLLTPDSDSDTDMLVGRPCEFTMDRPPLGRTVHGVVEKVEYLGVFNRGAPNERLGVRVHVVPALALMANRTCSRIFQDQTALSVIEDVLTGGTVPAGEPPEGLQAYQRTIDLEALDAAAYEPARDYCVQYRETDLAFVSRLLEEEGIAYFFDHQVGQAEVLKLVDTNEHYPEIETLDANPELPMFEANPDDAPVESIIRFDWSRTVKTTAVHLRHFDWLDPMQPIEAAGSSKAPGDVGTQVHEDYLHLDRRIREVNSGSEIASINDDSAGRLKAEVDRLALRDEIGHGESNVTGMQCGRVFELNHDVAPKRLLVTRVIHDGESPEEELGGGGGEEAPNYRNTFECTSLAATWRPPIVTPKPRIYGPQTAVVTGPPGEEIHVDAHGRIKVVMHWDRLWKRERSQRHDPTSSCWVRVGQAWAGAGWGTMFIPRIEMEVVVEFLEGNPDRPLVTGCVYNGKNRPPYPLPDEKTKSTVKSNSSLGGGGYNELRFEDLKGSEEVFIHAQKDMNEVVLNEHTTRVTSNQTHWVGGSRSRQVDGDESVGIGGNQMVKIDGGDKGGCGFSGNSIEVTGDYKLFVSNTIHIKAPTSITLECGGSKIVMTPSAINIVSGGNAKVVLDTNALTQSSQGSKVLLDGNGLFQSSGNAAVTLTGDANVKSSGGASVNLDGTAVATAKAGGMLKLDADVKTTGGVVTVASTSGGTLKLTADADLSGTIAKVAGSGGTVTLDANATVKGGLVKLNA
jgi:type VI secretion system secreted protein VgrG